MDEFNASRNPSGVWSYLWASDTSFSSFTLMTSDISSMGTPVWSGHISPDLSPSIWKNPSTRDTYLISANGLCLHAGPQLQPAVVRWTAPASYSQPVVIVGGFLPGDTGQPTVAVRLNNAELWSAVDAGSFRLTVPNGVTAGDTIDFAVYGFFTCGSTELKVHIVATAMHTIAAGELIQECILLPRLADGITATTATSADFEFPSPSWDGQIFVRPLAYGYVSSSLLPADTSYHSLLSFFYTSPIDYQGYARGPFNVEVKLSQSVGGASVAPAWPMTVIAGMNGCRTASNAAVDRCNRLILHLSVLLLCVPVTRLASWIGHIFSIQHLRPRHRLCIAVPVCICSSRIVVL